MIISVLCRHTQPTRSALQKIFFLCLAGALGSLCRYSASGFVHRVFNTSFPLGTFIVNCVGCFFFGLIWGFLEDRFGPQYRVVVLTGFMGAFTTFSTYMFESASLLQDSQWMAALINMIGQNVIGMALVICGLFLGRLI